MRTVAFVALMGCLLSWTVAASAQDRIAWVADWQEARDIAQQQHRLVLLHFYADGCLPCQKLERDVFPRREVARALSTGYVAVKINVDRFPHLRDHYKIVSWPTDVIVTAEGKEIARSVPSPADPNRYISMLDSARAQYGVGSHLNGHMTSGAPAGQLADRFGTGGFGGANSNNTRSSVYGPSPGPIYQPQPNMRRQRPTYIANNQFPDSYAPQPPIQANVTRPYGDRYPGRSGAAPGPGISQTNPHLQSPPVGLQDRSLNSPNDRRVADNTNQLNGNQFELQPPYQPNVGTPPAPSSSQFAMDGFCPVTLVDQDRWQKGDTRWGAVHEGKTYRFASQPGQQQFLASPDRFAPILSGYDPVRYAETGQLVEGKRQHGVRFGDRIYLFADEVALDRFSKHTEFYLARVREASLNRRGRPALR